MKNKLYRYIVEAILWALSLLLFTSVAYAIAFLANEICRLCGV